MSSPLLCTKIRFNRVQYYFLFLIALGIVLGSSPRSVAQGNWPMPGHDAQRTGRANFAGPTTAPTAPAWVYPTAGPIVGDIVTSAEGKLYLASDKLYALNPDGTRFVPAVAIGAAATGPVDDIAGLVYVAVSAADGGFDLLSFTKQLQGGSVLFHVPRAPNGVAIISPLLLGPGGMIYFVAGLSPGLVYAAGAVQWSNPVCPGQSGLNTPFGVSANGPALFNDGSSVVVMCGTPGTNGDLFKLDPFTGAQIASASGGERNLTEPAIDSLNHIHSGWQAFGGAIFCGDYLTWDFSLTLLTPQATFCDSSRFATSRAAVFPDGTSTVRIGFSFPPNNQLVATGAHDWISGTDGSTIPNFSSVPSVDAAGNVFIGNTQGIEALSSIDGHTLWSFSTGDAITTQPVVANGGVLYAGSSSGKVYAFNASPTPNSGTVYVTGAGGGFITVDLLSASVVATNGFTDSGAISVSPDGTRSYVSGIFGLNVVDNATNRVITTIPVGARPVWNAVSPDGSRVYVTQPTSSEVFVVDTATNSIITSVLVSSPQRVAVAPDNSRVYVGSNGRGIAVIDPVTNAITHFIDIIGANTSGITFTPDSTHAYVGDINGAGLYLIDARTDTFLQSISLPALGGGIGSVVASPDGKKIYAANVRTSPVRLAHNVFVLDTGTNSAIGQIPVSFPASQMAITSDGANVLVGDSDIGELVVASIATDSVVETIHVNNPCCPVISGVGTKPPAGALVSAPTGTLNLQSNVAATYAVTGPITFVATGTSVSREVPPGTYVVQFADIPHYFSPAPQTVLVTANTVVKVYGNYIIPVPTISNVSRDRVTRGQTISEFEVDGENFDPENVTLDLGDGISAEYLVKTFTKIIARITIAENAALGSHDLIVRDLDRQATRVAALTVIRKPVIVIPGIMGSVLERAQSPNELLWVDEARVFLSKCDDFLLPLALADDGQNPRPAFNFSCPSGTVASEGSAIVATDLLLGQGGFGSFEVPDAYSKLVNELTSSGFFVLRFPYDWRLSYTNAADLLRQVVTQIAPDADDRVDIVAHSQGGLVAQTYIALNQTDHRIGRIVFLSTPHLGATKSFAILEGWQDYQKFYGEPLFPSKYFNFNTMVFIGKTFPAAYELLPQFPFLSTDGILQGDVQATYDAEAASTRLKANLLATAREVWADLSSAQASHPTSFSINGTQHATLWRLDRSTTSHCSMIPHTDLFGDGTVPSVSLNALANTKYFYINEEHSALPNNTLVSSSVPKLLDGVDTETLFGMGFSRTPLAAEPLVIHTCSPVRMLITDSSGNQNGFDGLGSLLRQVPGSDFYAFDENEASSLPLSTYRIDLTATSAGLFSLVFRTGSQEAVSQFTDIPISFTSRASVLYSPENPSLQLQLDIDGDGIPDFSISSGAPVPLQSYFAALQNILSTLPLAADVRSVLADRIRQAQMAFGQGHIHDVRKKLLEFNTDIDKFAAKQLLMQSQVVLLKDLSNKALNAL